MHAYFVSPQVWGPHATTSNQKLRQYRRGAASAPNLQRVRLEAQSSACAARLREDSRGTPASQFPPVSLSPCVSCSPRKLGWGCTTGARRVRQRRKSLSRGSRSRAPVRRERRWRTGTRDRHCRRQNVGVQAGRQPLPGRPLREIVHLGESAAAARRVDVAGLGPQREDRKGGEETRPAPELEQGHAGARSRRVPGAETALPRALLEKCSDLCPVRERRAVAAFSLAVSLSQLKASSSPARSAVHLRAASGSAVRRRRPVGLPDEHHEGQQADI